MKKTLAILVTLAMVLSLFSGLAGAQVTQPVRVYDEKGAFVKAYDDLATALADINKLSGNAGNGYTVRIVDKYGPVGGNAGIAKNKVTILGVGKAADLTVAETVYVDYVSAKVYASNLTLQNVTVQSEVYLRGQGHVVKDCEIKGSLKLADSARNITVSSNKFSSPNAKIELGKLGTGVKITQNNIEECEVTNGAQTDSGIVDMTLNYWGDKAGPTVTGSGQTYTPGNKVVIDKQDRLNLQPWLDKDVTKSPTSVFAVKNATDNKFFWSIAGAMAAGSGFDPGDVLNLGPFTFSEVLDLTKSVTIVGIPADSADKDPKSVIKKVGAEVYVVRVGHDTAGDKAVTLKDLTIDGAALAPATNADYGVFVVGGTQNNVAVTLNGVSVKGAVNAAVYATDAVPGNSKAEKKDVTVTVSGSKLDTGTAAPGLDRFVYGAAVHGAGSKAKLVVTNNTISQKQEDAVAAAVYQTRLADFTGNTLKGQNDPKRLSGTDRYNTAVAISNEWYFANQVFLATGTGFADALAGVVMAGQDKLPILLTAPNAMPAAVLQQLGPLGLNASTVTILGGTGAVSGAVASQLTNAGFHVERVSGTDRYATAVEIAKKVRLNDLKKTAIIARGDDFADALAAGPLATLMNAPILLVERDRIPAVVKNYIEENMIQHFLIVGGQGAVSNQVADELLGMFDTLSVDRLHGSDRYATCQKIVQKYLDEKGAAYDPNAIILATGADYPDALAGGALACYKDCPIVLTPSGSLAKSARETLEKMKKDHNLGANDVYYILGGKGAVSDGVFNSIQGQGFNAIFVATK